MVTVNNKNKTKFLRNFLFIYLLVAVISTTINTQVKTAFAVNASTTNTKLEVSKYPPIVKNIEDGNKDNQVKYFFEDGSFMLVGKEIADEINRRKEQKIQEEKERERNTVVPVNKTEEQYVSITKYTDLSVNKTITTDDMNLIIEYWNSKCGGTPFLGRGDVFIKASKESGLDPIYILAHAAVESSWGNSDLAIQKGNYFGIGAFDRDPYNSAYTMGEDISSSIINGAKWIDRNYYEQGQNSLYEMIYGKQMYASAADSWINQIESIMNTSYYIIQTQDI